MSWDIVTRIDDYWGRADGGARVTTAAGGTAESVTRQRWAESTTCVRTHVPRTAVSTVPLLRVTRDQQ